MTEMLTEMLRLAKEFGVATTENTEKIANARVRMGIPITVCPCAAKEEGRGCIGPKCLQEIEEEGVCHCHAFRRIGGNNGELNTGSSAL